MLFIPRKVRHACSAKFFILAVSSRHSKCCLSVCPCEIVLVLSFSHPSGLSSLDCQHLAQGSLTQFLAMDYTRINLILSFDYGGRFTPFYKAVQLGRKRTILINPPLLLPCQFLGFYSDSLQWPLGARKQAIL